MGDDVPLFCSCIHWSAPFESTLIEIEDGPLLQFEMEDDEAVLSDVRISDCSLPLGKI